MTPILGRLEDVLAQSWLRRSFKISPYICYGTDLISTMCSRKPSLMPALHESRTTVLSSRAPVLKLAQPYGTEIIRRQLSRKDTLGRRRSSLASSELRCSQKAILYSHAATRQLVAINGLKSLLEFISVLYAYPGPLYICRLEDLESCPWLRQ
ncbi:hypothetical protein BDV10DRAFT_72002 [Aspergillus recurvatus]